MQQIVTTETHNGVKGLEYRTTLRTATGKGLSGLSTYGSTPEESRKEMAKHIQERDIRRARELRELISVAQCMLREINAEDELTPREIAERRTKNKFSVIGGR